MGIIVESTGSFDNTVRFLHRLGQSDAFYSMLQQYGQKGVDALSAATPVESGLTAHSWTYEIRRRRGTFEIVWKNSHVVKGANIALLIQYGHGTGTGGYVQGRDYINPAMRPIFDAMLADIRKVVRA